MCRWKNRSGASRLACGGETCPCRSRKRKRPVGGAPSWSSTVSLTGTAGPTSNNTGSSARKAKSFGPRPAAKGMVASGAPALVDALHEHRRVAGLLQRGRRRPALQLHPRLRVDVDDEKDPGVEDLLQLPPIARLTGGRELPAGLRRQGRAEVRQGLGDA